MALWLDAVDEARSQRGGGLLVAMQAPAAAPGPALGAAARFVGVGLIDTVVVGFVTAHLAEHAVPPVAVIDILYVEPPAREIGVGEALTQCVVDWAVGHGCRGLDAPALPGNRRAKAFFEDNGFVARVLTMHRPLVPVPPAAAGVGAGALPAGVAGRPVPGAVEVGVGAIAVDSGRLLLVRRATRPGAGQWSVPGGHVEPGETLAEAVVREVREETGLDATCGRFVGSADVVGDGHHFVVLDFVVSVGAGTEPVAGDDAAEAAWVPLGAVGDLDLVDGLAGFLRDHAILPTGD